MVVILVSSLRISLSDGRGEKNNTLGIFGGGGGGGGGGGMLPLSELHLVSNYVAQTRS